MRDDAQDRFVTLPGGTRVCYRIDGDPGDPPALLLAGLGEDLTMWSERFVSALVATGFQVIRMDNRDCGRSTYAITPPPSTLRQLLARPRPDAYTLADMAADAAQLIEHLGRGPAHLIGRSMGGMIAQTVAARYPHRRAVRRHRHRCRDSACTARGDSRNGAPPARRARAPRRRPRRGTPRKGISVSELSTTDHVVIGTGRPGEIDAL
ncbi:alpha/beta fold hydrolase [Rhodococcus oxybenzonivorans]|uniref:alpha/beta fold hydrolase n=1 Tax=Rhodococcus oxybenzonivorans TaxID=1990687 RepID=UPI001E5C1A3E|nr:alpha/beta fold hydrolase [Rhodococcus oxybenzonivorans]